MVISFNLRSTLRYNNRILLLLVWLWFLGKNLKSKIIWWNWGVDNEHKCDKAIWNFRRVCSRRKCSWKVLNWRWRRTDSSQWQNQGASSYKNENCLKFQLGLVIQRQWCRRLAIIRLHWMPHTWIQLPSL